MCDQMENGAENPAMMPVERETESANEKKRPTAKAECTMRCRESDRGGSREEMMRKSSSKQTAADVSISGYAVKRKRSSLCGWSDTEGREWPGFSAADAINSLTHNRTGSVSRS
jgi:hypothetical protein